VRNAGIVDDTKVIS